MSNFTQELNLTQLDQKQWRLWRVITDFKYVTNSGNTIVVPAGFKTDGATIPKILWTWLPAWGKYSRAAVVHDYLCRRIEEGTPHSTSPTRKEADDIFFEAMTDCEVSLFVKRVMYTAVRLFSIYKDYKRT